MLPDKENQHLPQKLNYFECPMCGQCFSTFSNIESHMKLKHQKNQHKLQQNQKQQEKKKQQIDMQKILFFGASRSPKSTKLSILPK